MPAAQSTIKISDLKAVYGGADPVKMSNCFPSTTSLIRTQDVTSQLPGTTFAVPFNGTDIDSISGIVPSQRYVNRTSASALVYTSGLGLPNGTLAADFSANPGATVMQQPHAITL